MPATSPITFTLDLEDHRPDEHAELRYPAATRTVLAHLAAHDITATFFVIGEVAREQPDLVREVAAAGHEVALHGWQHVPLVEHDPASFRRDITQGRDLLQELTGQPVVGYRAPTFSLVPDTLWALDVLHDEGFAYSSSVLPTANPLYGFPGAPLDPFRWSVGLAEFPVPIAGVGRFRVPYLGGTYLRLLPRPVISRAHRRGGRRTPWTYMHPYDIDPDEPRWHVPDAGRLSPLLWVGRRRVLTKLDALVGPGQPPAGPPLRDRMADADAGGTYDPAVMVKEARP